MKKFLPYILILTIVVQLFAPFSVGLGKNNIKVIENKTEASQGFISSDLGIKLNTRASVTSKSISLQIEVEWKTNTWLSSESVIVGIKGPDGTGQVSDPITLKPAGKLNQSGSVTFPDLTPNTTYDVYIKADQDSASLLARIFNLGTWIPRGIGKWIGADNWPVVGKLFEKNKSEGEITNYNNPYQITTLADGDTSTQTIDLGIIKNEASFLPTCALDNIGGCIGIIIYRLIFQPSAYIFGLLGKIFDYTFAYSIKDTSYRSEFVVEGWQLMRDICNMFFIFVLLYIAIGTILQMNGVKAKEMIINVVIIGLLINFSLFTTQVIIDASNILARVFYNQILVGNKDKESGKINEETGNDGEKKISEALIAKINPQQILMRAEEAGSIKTKGAQLNDGEQQKNEEDGVNVVTFIFVAILASVMNIVGIIVFLSVSIVMITRVVGLWIAMIIAPVAFFTYTIPKAKNVDTVGWEKWWPNLINMAFLAPVFIFFIYLIIKFLETGLGMGDASTKTGLDFYIAVLVPFTFLMVLLMKAKNITVKMSGELGQSITKGIAAAGVVALGATAGGIALAGRQVIGRGMAKMSRGDTSTQKYMEAKRLKATGDSSAWDKLNWRQKAIGATTTVGGRVKTDKLQTWTGGLLNKAQEKVGKTDKARHKEDEVKKALGLENVDNTNLSGTDIKNMQNKYKEMEGGNVEAQFRKGVDAKGAVLSMTDSATGNTYTGESDFKARNRQSIINDVHAGGDPNDIDFYSGELTDAGKKKVEDQLTVKLNAIIKENADSKVVEKFNEMRRDASTHVNPALRGFSGANKSSYDIRKISEMKTDQREGFLTKGTVGLAAIIAGGVRTGLRGSGFGNSKIKVEGDFLKDLGNTISDSLKNMKVNVDLSHVGEHKSSADAHGGGEHH